MSPFSASPGRWRLTSVLGATATLTTAAVAAWMIVSASHIKLSASLPPGNKTFQLTHDRKGDFAAALAAAPAQPALSDWNSDLDWLRNHPTTPQTFVEDPKPARLERAGAPNPVTAQIDLESEHANGAAPQALTPPVPRAAAEAPPPPAPRAAAEAPPPPALRAAVPPAPQVALPQDAAPRVRRTPGPLALARRARAEHRKQALREAKAEPAAPAGPAAKPHKVAAARPSYLEKYAVQGDAGEVKFGYRRHACAPGHMVDVCYMPPANRRNIVVERY
jgi:hypothetical protein